MVVLIFPILSPFDLVQDVFVYSGNMYCIHAEIAVYKVQNLCIYYLIACTVLYIFPPHVPFHLKNKKKQN